MESLAAAVMHTRKSTPGVFHFQFPPSGPLQSLGGLQEALVAAMAGVRPEVQSAVVPLKVGLARQNCEVHVAG